MSAPSRRRRRLLSVLLAGALAGVLCQEVGFLAGGFGERFEQRRHPTYAGHHLGDANDVASAGAVERSLAPSASWLGALAATWALAPDRASAAGGYDFGMTLLVGLPIVAYGLYIFLQIRSAPPAPAKPPSWTMRNSKEWRQFEAEKGAQKATKDLKVPRRMRRQAEREGWD
uniref:Uncharacterized protein n=2 Tax=Alexandrium andersonii TaxID=327968 RepID=A0A7S2NDR9_9DINO